MNRDTLPNAWATVTNSRGTDQISRYPKLVADFECQDVSLPRRKGKRRVILCRALDVEHQHNNYAELVGMVVALRIALEAGVEYFYFLDDDLRRGLEVITNLPGDLVKETYSFLSFKVRRYREVASDSRLITEWWSKGLVNEKTMKVMLEKDPRKYQVIQECSRLRKRFEAEGGRISRVPGDENPADLGYH